MFVKYRKSLHSERGATLVEYALALALLVTAFLIGVPRTEEQVENRINAGKDLWATWNFQPEIEEM